MLIQLNGESHELQSPSSISQLIEQLELTEKRLAVELNGEIIPRSEYGSTPLQPDDRLEIVHAIGGG